MNPDDFITDNEERRRFETDKSICEVEHHISCQVS